MTATAERKGRKNPPARKKVTAHEALELYDEVFEEIRRFTSVIQGNEEELEEAHANLAKAKAALEKAKAVVRDIQDLREGARLGLLRYLTPADGKILPLFDRMEPADEKVHGAHSQEWRTEPIAALRLSLPATKALNDADVMLVGQLQDRMLKSADKWWEEIPGLNFGMAAAIADLLADFINERSSR